MRSSFLRISTVVPLLAATLLGGCGTLDVPRADNYPATGQKKARAVHHWDVLAGDVAARVAEKIASWPAGEYPIHVTVADKSSFNAGFLKLLTVHLLNRGVVLYGGTIISTHQAAPAEVAYAGAMWGLAIPNGGTPVFHSDRPTALLVAGNSTITPAQSEAIAVRLHTLVTKLRA